MLKSATEARAFAMGWNVLVYGQVILYLPLHVITVTMSVKFADFRCQGGSSREK
jgi:hypothetical protein